jgi:hypothetical protein
VQVAVGHDEVRTFGLHTVEQLLDAREPGAVEPCPAGAVVEDSEEPPHVAFELGRGLGLEVADHQDVAERGAFVGVDRFVRGKEDGFELVEPGHSMAFAAVGCSV